MEVDRTDATAVVVLNRPEHLNALTEFARRELLAHLLELDSDLDVRAMILTGAGRAFCSGQDLTELEDMQDTSNVIRETYNPLIAALTGTMKPVIAAINGPAVGAGLGLALACDIRLMAENAFLLSGFAGVGLVPDSGVSWVLPRIVGYSRAFDIACSGRRVTAAEALELGLADYVAPLDELMPSALRFASALADGPVHAIGLTKRLLRRSLHLGLLDALELEALTQGEAARTQEHREALTAFTEKREPLSAPRDPD